MVFVFSRAGARVGVLEHWQQPAEPTSRPERHPREVGTLRPEPRFRLPRHNETGAT